jgi:hypothetical protein
MNQAGDRVGVRRWSGVWVDRAAASGQAYPLFMSLTSSTRSFDANPTRRLLTLDAGGSSREQQKEKGRKR